MHTHKRGEGEKKRHSFSKQHTKLHSNSVKASEQFPFPCLQWRVYSTETTLSRQSLLLNIGTQELLYWVRLIVHLVQ